MSFKPYWVGREFRRDCGWIAMIYDVGRKNSYGMLIEESWSDEQILALMERAIAGDSGHVDH